jgi:spermidine synthase
LFSGFNLLALEVIWTRMLAQVHENSVYGFSTVLIVVLACLALGAWLASWLARGKSPASQTLVGLVAAGGTLLAVSPFIFVGLTGNLAMLPAKVSFSAICSAFSARHSHPSARPACCWGRFFPS